MSAIPLTLCAHTVWTLSSLSSWGRLSNRSLPIPHCPQCYNCTSDSGEHQRDCPADCGTLGRSVPAIWCLMLSVCIAFLVLEPSKVGCASAAAAARNRGRRRREAKEAAEARARALRRKKLPGDPIAVVCTPPARNVKLLLHPCDTAAKTRLPA